MGLHALQNCRLHNVLLQILKIDVETPTPGWTHGLLHYMKTVETGIENRKLDDVSGADFVVLPPLINKLDSFLPTVWKQALGSKLLLSM